MVSEEEIQRLVNILQRSEQVKERVNVIEILGKTGDNRVLPYLIKAYGLKIWPVHKAIFKAMLNLDEEEAIMALTRFLPMFPGEERDAYIKETIRKIAAKLNDLEYVIKRLEIMVEGQDTVEDKRKARKIVLVVLHAMYEGIRGAKEATNNGVLCLGVAKPPKGRKEMVRIMKKSTVL